jgi:hypothetical protein
MALRRDESGKALIAIVIAKACKQYKVYKLVGTDIYIQEPMWKLGEREREGERGGERK